MPYWISRLAIIYANLCRQFQKLQTLTNVLIYDMFFYTGGPGYPQSLFLLIVTLPMPRLIGVFAGRTGHFVGFVMLRLIYFLTLLSSTPNKNLNARSI